MLHDTHLACFCSLLLGVGRLALEIGAMGYRVQGNEFSLFMLLASDFVLNSGTCSPEHPLAISPWLLETRNVHGPLDPVRTVSIPDVDPTKVLCGDAPSDENNNNIHDDDDGNDYPDFSMAAGDFLCIYGHSREAHQWDGVVSCFFLDAAPCIVEYLLVIYNMLKPGGMLFNMGPLLYHWSGPAMRPDDLSIEHYECRYRHLDRRYLDSVDLSWSDVRNILENIGFEILEEHVGVRALYTADRRSMMNMEYRCIQFVAQKRKKNNKKSNTTTEETNTTEEEEEEQQQQQQVVVEEQQQQQEEVVMEEEEQQQQEEVAEEQQQQQVVVMDEQHSVDAAAAVAATAAVEQVMDEQQQQQQQQVVMEVQQAVMEERQAEQQQQQQADETANKVATEQQQQQQQQVVVEGQEQQQVAAETTTATTAAVAETQPSRKRSSQELEESKLDDDNQDDAMEIS
eukprot:CAMPEP_0116851646 /NCGR_PEP_ID=MMETSP0418-20121206/16849_1 /TAXON_ID=1158023 /ORGANISM="Astrosyne radiata, Strain 13vi08-1A" /LENGTH=454 /DNA_ID=CAMNT_0004483713 /DNA_START=284 /DNA_END=1648 /DNA_ORIENTATION=-